jgi:CBS domain-containing protein
MKEEVIQSHRVHVRRVVGEGTLTRERHVFCPAQHRHVDVDGCKDCPKLFALDHTHRGTLMMCRMPASPSAREHALTGSGESRAAQVPSSAVMSAQVTCVRPDASLQVVLALLIECGHGVVPVVDVAGNPVGIVSKTDVVRTLEEHVRDDGAPLLVRTDEGISYELGPGFQSDALGAISVGDIMSPLVFAIHRDASLARAASVMAYEGIHGLPVLDDDGRVVGMLSALDVMRWIATDAGYALPDAESVSR